MRCLFLSCDSSGCCSRLLHVRRLRNSVCVRKVVCMYTHTAGTQLQCARRCSLTFIISITSTDCCGHILSLMFAEKTQILKGLIHTDTHRHTQHPAASMRNTKHTLYRRTGKQLNLVKLAKVLAFRDLNPTSRCVNM